MVQVERRHVLEGVVVEGGPFPDDLFGLAVELDDPLSKHLLRLSVDLDRAVVEDQREKIPVGHGEHLVVDLERGIDR